MKQFSVSDPVLEAKLKSFIKSGDEDYPAITKKLLESLSPLPLHVDPKVNELEEKSKQLEEESRKLEEESKKIDRQLLYRPQAKGQGLKPGGFKGGGMFKGMMVGIDPEEVNRRTSLNKSKKELDEKNNDIKEKINNTKKEIEDIKAKTKNDKLHILNEELLSLPNITQTLSLRIQDYIENAKKIEAKKAEIQAIENQAIENEEESIVVETPVQTYTFFGLQYYKPPESPEAKAAREKKELKEAEKARQLEEGEKTLLSMEEAHKGDLAKIQIAINAWFDEAKEKITKEHPLNFDQEIKELFLTLPIDVQERFKHLQSEHVIHVLEKDTLVTIDPNNEAAKKEQAKAKILYQIETSKLQHDIITAISDVGSEKYTNKIIETTMQSILNEFKRGQEQGAYKFKYPGSIKETLHNLLGNQVEMLKERERNEIELAYYIEQCQGLKELAEHPGKYNIEDRAQGTQYEGLLKQNMKGLRECMARKQELDAKLESSIEKFIENEAYNIHEPSIKSIQEELGLEQKPQDIDAILAQAEKKTQLGWYDWLSSATFYSRCKTALIGATAAGAAGGIAGTMTGMGIFSSTTGALGTAGGALLGGAAGFMAPEISDTTKSKISDLKKLASNFLYGAENALALEYFEDAREYTGLNAKYKATPEMVAEWGLDGANVIAFQYTNLIFELHMKLLYDPPSDDPDQKDLLKRQHMHFYRNYQMLRGDENEIKKLYQGKTWGTDTAENEIKKSKELNLREQVKQDLAAMLVILKNEDKENYKTHLQSIKTLNKTMDEAKTDPKLLSLLKDAPEIIILSPAMLPKVEAPPLLDATASPQDEKSIEVNFHRQLTVSEAKENAIVIANAENKREEIGKKYKQLEALSKIANRNKLFTGVLDQSNPGFVINSTKHMADMNNTKAGEHLHQRDYAKFKYWFENIFLNKNKDADEVTRQDAISRDLLGVDGKKILDGKSIWHLLSEDSLRGKDTLAWMFKKQTEAKFGQFIDYFDFGHKDTKNGLNAIVYAASLSSQNNDSILKTYIEELFKGYGPASKEKKTLCDETFKKIIDRKVPEDPAYELVCSKLTDEIKLVWEKKQNEIHKKQSIFKRATHAVTTTLGLASAPPPFKSTKVHSQLLAAIAIYCTNKQKIPKSDEDINDFLRNFFINSNVFGDKKKGDIRDIINSNEIVEKMSHVTKLHVENQTILSAFAAGQEGHIRKMAMELCGSDPSPTPSEQKVLVALLANDNFTLKMKEKPFKNTVMNLLEKKINGKNLIWLAVEADRPEIAGILYNLSSKAALMDEAGPGKASAFTFAASQEDKKCITEFCVQLSKRTGIFQKAYMTRYKPDQTNGRLAIHYLAENATFEQLNTFFNTEKLRFSYPNWKKLTGMTKTPPVSSQDKVDKNLPLHLLLKRSDASKIVTALCKSIDEGKLKGTKTIFDLFEVESLEIKNAKQETPMSLIKDNDDLQEALFDSLRRNADKFSTDPQYRGNLFKCAVMALKNENDILFGKLVKTIVDVHQSPKNVGYGYLANPVTAQVDALIREIVAVHQSSTNDEYQRTLRDHLPELLTLATPYKLITIMEKILKQETTPENQALVETLFNAVKKDLTPDESKKYKVYLDIEEKPSAKIKEVKEKIPEAQISKIPETTESFLARSKPVSFLSKVEAQGEPVQPNPTPEAKVPQQVQKETTASDSPSNKTKKKKQ